MVKPNYVNPTLDYIQQPGYRLQTIKKNREDIIAVVFKCFCMNNLSVLTKT